MDAILNILQAVLLLFIQMAPYLMLGLVFVGLLNIFFTKDLVTKHIGKNNFMSIFKAAMFGVPLPLCSCGVIPSAVYMAKNGASKPSVVSFLISTPQTGIDSILATYGMMGPIFAIFRPFAALLMGLIGGIVTKFATAKDELRLEKKIDIPLMQKSALAPEVKNFKYYASKSLIYPFIEFLDDITPQFIVGLFIAGLITYLVPDNFFSGTFISNGIIGMIVTVLIGVPMYVCATASIPIALSMMMKGFSPGIAFVFLAAGPATNAASIAVLSKVLGKKITAIFVLTISLSSIAFGLLLDLIFNITGIDPHAQMSHLHVHDMSTVTLFDWIISSVFFILVLLSIYRLYLKPRFKPKDENIMENSGTKINIEGMTCNHCVMNVQKAITGTSGVTGVDVKLSDNAAYVEGDFKLNDLKKAVEDMGYKVVE
jgi:uncharacterized membrane protein YraQ (UPF0718 family)/copper chaperone CopZ